MSLNPHYTERYIYHVNEVRNWKNQIHTTNLFFPAKYIGADRISSPAFVLELQAQIDFFSLFQQLE